MLTVGGDLDLLALSQVFLVFNENYRTESGGFKGRACSKRGGDHVLFVRRIVDVKLSTKRGLLARAAWSLRELLPCFSSLGFVFEIQHAQDKSMHSSTRVVSDSVD